MKTDNYKEFRKTCTPAHIGRYMETCTDEEFAEIFVNFMKYRKTGKTGLTVTDMHSFPLEECTGLIHDILEDIIFNDDTDSGAWWKKQTA